MPCWSREPIEKHIKKSQRWFSNVFFDWLTGATWKSDQNMDVDSELPITTPTLRKIITSSHLFFISFKLFSPLIHYNVVQILILRLALFKYKYTGNHIQFSLPLVSPSCTYPVPPGCTSCRWRTTAGWCSWFPFPPQRDRGSSGKHLPLKLWRQTS